MSEIAIGIVGLMVLLLLFATGIELGVCHGAGRLCGFCLSERLSCRDQPPLKRCV